MNGKGTKGFMFFLSFREIIEAMGGEDVKAVLLALVDLVEHDKEPEDGQLSPIARIAFVSMQRDVMAALDIWRQRLERESEAGRKAGIASAKTRRKARRKASEAAAADGNDRSDSEHPSTIVNDREPSSTIVNDREPSLTIVNDFNKRNEMKRNEMKRNEMKRNETKENNPPNPPTGGIPSPSPPKDKAEARKPSPEQVNAIIDELNSKAGTAFRASSKRTQALIKARMNEGFTVEDFFEVIRKKSKEWKYDSKMSQYLRPETLFGQKFEGYLNAPEPKQQNRIGSSGNFEQREMSKDFSDQIYKRAWNEIEKANERNAS